jgi:hypothetical protein
MPEAGMQQGSLIKSGRKRGPDVWQFRWADKGPFGKRIYRRRVIGTVFQYTDRSLPVNRWRDCCADSTRMLSSDAIYQ